MALIKCIECGKEFSSFASACPNCSCPTEIILKQDKAIDCKQTLNNENELNVVIKEVILKNPHASKIVNLIRENKSTTVELTREYNRLSGSGLVKALDLVKKLQENINWKKCPNCGSDIFEEDNFCVKCKKPIGNSIKQQEETIPQTESLKNEVNNLEEAINIGVGSYRDTSIRCPKCGSNNYKVISGTSKAASWALLGPFAAGKILSKYHCQNCNHNY